VADFIGTCNILEAEVARADDGRVQLRIGGLGEVAALNMGGVTPGMKGVLALRPEQVAIGQSLTPQADENRFSGRIFDFLYLGDVTVYVVELPNGSRVEAMLPNSAPGRAKFFEAGDAVEISWRIDAGRFLTD
jgi:spermidine/putrescine transport system ATP-binding protein